ncbi:hypothetical protein K474DRAFT_1568356, partial [Panus rudis PR-1116 ss-1]
KRVILHGPRAKPQEGGSDPNSPTHEVNAQYNTGEGDVPSNTNTAQATPEPNEGPEAPSPSFRPEGDMFIEHVSGSSDGIELEGVLANRYAEDPFFKTILENPKHFKNFVIRNGLIFIKERGEELLCIPDIRVGERSVREIVILHAHSLLAHLGTYKTLGLLRNHVWWKT